MYLCGAIVSGVDGDGGGLHYLGNSAAPCEAAVESNGTALPPRSAHLAAFYHYAVASRLAATGFHPFVGVLLHYDERLRPYNIITLFLSACGGDGISGCRRVCHVHVSCPIPEIYYYI